MGQSRLGKGFRKTCGNDALGDNPVQILFVAHQSAIKPCRIVGCRIK